MEDRDQPTVYPLVLFLYELKVYFVNLSVHLDVE